MNLFMGQFWVLVSAVLGVFGVVYVPSDADKAVVAAAAGLVVSVWQWQHHKTIRQQHAQVAELSARKIDAAQLTREQVAALERNTVRQVRYSTAPLHDRLAALESAHEVRPTMQVTTNGAAPAPSSAAATPGPVAE